MTADQIAPDAYDTVLADLRAKRDQIDKTIALLTALRGGGPASVVATESPAQDAIVETAGMFLGMSIVDASKKLLAMRKRTLGNVEIARDIQAGGLALSSKEPVNVVGSVLTRRFNEVGDVVKVGRGIWGLKEWYPNRNFKTNAKPSATQPTTVVYSTWQAATQEAEFADEIETEIVSDGQVRADCP